MNNPYAAVVAELDFIANDQAILNSVLHKNPDFVRWCTFIADRQFQASKARITPLPALGTILALEATVFDNGDEPKFRHKITLKAYTGSTVGQWKRPAWQATATLWPHVGALKIAKRSKANFTAETLQVIEVFADQGAGYVGVFMHSGAGIGSSYNDLHIVWVDVENAKAMVYSPTDHFWLAPFETTDARGKPLKKNAALHSRSSSSSSLDHWATGEATPL